MVQVLLIDDDPLIQHRLRGDFNATDVELTTADTTAAGLAAIEASDFDVVILDVMLPDGSGLDAFKQVRERDAHLPVIFITTNDESTTAIEAMTLGAYDYLLKPLDRKQVRELVTRASEIRRAMQTPVAFEIGDETRADVLVGRCPAMQEVYKAIGRVAAQDVTVLVRGESGTGKELVARALYQHSRRADKPFLAINCAAIPETLLESELFGHEAGAFTGADRRRIGKFEQCAGGTLFLDEIGEMTAATQSKLLRLLQERAFERVGGNETITSDVRVIAATNVDLEAAVEGGDFRGDLLYRVNVFTINLPPLRERRGDLPLLLKHFLARFRRELGKPIQGLAPETLDRLMNYSWPGNIRELQNVLKQSLLHSAGNVLLPEFLPELSTPDDTDETHRDDWTAFLRERVDAGSQQLFAEATEKMERAVLTFVLRETGGNQLRAAEMLGITRGTLRNKIRALGITIQQVVDDSSDADE